MHENAKIRVGRVALECLDQAADEDGYSAQREKKKKGVRDSGTIIRGESFFVAGHTFKADAVIVAAGAGPFSDDTITSLPRSRLYRSSQEGAHPANRISNPFF